MTPEPVALSTTLVPPGACGRWQHWFSNRNGCEPDTHCSLHHTIYQVRRCWTKPWHWSWIMFSRSIIRWVDSKIENCPVEPNEIEQVTYRFNNFIQNGCFIRFGCVHVPFVDLKEFTQLLNVLILLFPTTFLIITFVYLRLRLFETDEEEKNRAKHGFSVIILGFRNEARAVNTALVNNQITYFVIRFSSNFFRCSWWTCHGRGNRVHYFRLRLYCLNLLMGLRLLLLCLLLLLDLMSQLVWCICGYWWQQWCV